MFSFMFFYVISPAQTRWINYSGCSRIYRYEKPL